MSQESFHEASVENDASDLSLEDIEGQIFEQDPVLLPEMVQVTSDQMERMLVTPAEPVLKQAA